MEQNSIYTSVSGDNVLFWKDGKFHCDCSGMIKALLNEFDIYNVKEGDKLSNFEIIGDKNSKEIIDACTDISTDFTLLKPLEPRFVYFTVHIGVYIGKEVEYGSNANKVCNVVECTSSWDGGIQLSYVDKNRNRYNKKNGSVSSKKWGKHGLPSLWVKFNEISCDFISPIKASDCVLSSEDKRENYKYCCYYHIYKDYPICSAVDEIGYKLHLSLIEDGEVFECNPKPETKASTKSSDCKNINPKKPSVVHFQKRIKNHLNIAVKKNLTVLIRNVTLIHKKAMIKNLNYINSLKNMGLKLFLNAIIKK